MAQDSEFFGDRVYSGGERVPLVAFRCRSLPRSQSNAHKCRSHHEHSGNHKCICGMAWDATGEVIK